MSEPAPVTEKVPEVSLARPATAGEPTSRFDRGDACTVTFENEAVASCELSTLVSARPT